METSFHDRRFVSCAIWAVAVAFCLLLEASAETTAAKGRLLVVNKTDRTLGIIDPASGENLGVVALDAVTGHEVAATPDGRRAFVPIFGSGGVGTPGTDGQHIRVVDIAERKVVHTVDLGRGMRPHGAVINRQDGLLYVTTEVDDSVTVVDPEAIKVVGRVPTGQPESHMLVLSSDGKKGYTSNVGPGTVSVLDLENRRTVAVIPVSKRAQRIAISPDDKWVFTADQAQPQIAAIDTAANAVRHRIELPGTGYGMAVTLDNRRLILCLIGLSKVAEVDLKSRKVVRTLDVPKAPQEVLLRPDGAVAFVSCDRSGQVAVVDLRKWAVERLITAGQGADGLAWAPGTFALTSDAGPR